MGFTHVQGKEQDSVGSVTSLVIVLPSTPTPGNVICIAINWSDTISAVTVKDSNNNSYTLSTSTPFVGSVGPVGLAYLLSAPGNATATITASWTTSRSAVMWAEEFSISGGTASYDTDNTANGTAAAIATPTISPALTGSLLWATAQVQNAVTHPTADEAVGSWVGAHGGISPAFATMTEYLLSSAAGSNAVNFTQSPSGAFDGIVLAIKFTASGGIFEHGDYLPPKPTSIDSNVTVWQ